MSRARARLAFGDSPTPPAEVPSQPLVESVVAGDRQVTVRWTPALAEEGSPITAYRVRVRTDPAEEPVQTIDAPADAVESVITGLANGATHHVTVVAVNRAGESPTGDWSTFPVTPQGPPSVPLEATAAEPCPRFTEPELEASRRTTGESPSRAIARTSTPTQREASHCRAARSSWPRTPPPTCGAA